MSQFNPYAAPKSVVADVPATDIVDFERMNRVASGQRIVIVSLLVSLAAIAVRARVSPEAGLLFSILASVVAVFGAVRLDGGLNGSALSRVLYAIAILLPLINLLIMVSLNARATKALPAAGYKVGFFGTSARRDA